MCRYAEHVGAHTKRIVDPLMREGDGVRLPRPTPGIAVSPLPRIMDPASARRAPKGHFFVV
jgi:hypothetical protein